MKSAEAKYSISIANRQAGIQSEQAKTSTRQADIQSKQADIGGRQVEILAEQAKIAARQLALAEMKLRVDVFEDRFAVYKAVREWLIFIVGEGRAPLNASPDQFPDEASVLKDFMAAWDKSRFLFRPEVFAKLDELRRKSHQLRYHQKMQRGAASQFDHDQAENFLLVEFGEVNQTLSQIFGEELNLSVHGSTHGGLDREEQKAKSVSAISAKGTEKTEATSRDAVGDAAISTVGKARIRPKKLTAKKPARPA